MLMTDGENDLTGSGPHHLTHAGVHTGGQTSLHLTAVDVIFHLAAAGERVGEWVDGYTGEK